MSNKAKPYGAAWARAMKLYARQNGVKGYGIAILDVLIDHRDYETGKTFPGRSRIMSLTGASRNTLHHWLNKMRNDGVIVPLAYLNGGHARATVYGFPVAAWTHPSQVVNGLVLAKSTPPEIDNNPPKKWATTPPKNGHPTVINNYKQGKGIKDGASRPEAGGNTKPESQALIEVRLLSEWTKKHGYGAAREMLDKWKHEMPQGIE